MTSGSKRDREEEETDPASPRCHRRRWERPAFWKNVRIWKDCPLEAARGSPRDIQAQTAAGWEPGHMNTYVEFFKLFLNLAVHLNGVKPWMPNRKRFNKQQCSIGPDFRVSGLERWEEFQNPKSWQAKASAQSPSSDASSVSTQACSYLHVTDNCSV